MTSPSKAWASSECQRIIQELEAATQHLKDCQQHLQNSEIPRYAAHLLATQGHLLNAQRTLNELTLAHAARSTPSTR